VKTQENAMSRLTTVGIAVAASICIAGGALQAQTFASSGDLAYCSALSESYKRYVGDPGESANVARHMSRRADVTGETAVANCQQGNAAAAIPVLERKLIDAKVPLPPRR
jgi:hypothetical protein